MQIRYCSCQFYKYYAGHDAKGNLVLMTSSFIQSKERWDRIVELVEAINSMLDKGV